MKWLLGYLCALCILTLAVCESVALPTFFVPFYSHEYDKYHIPETIGVEKEELLTVTRHLLRYMQGKEDDLDVNADVNGENRAFFNQREKDHMVDVKNLFKTGYMVRNIAFWTLLFLLQLMFFCKIKCLPVLTRCLREIFAGFVLLAVALIIVVAVDFDRAFNTFHLLFFTNDLWQLNPKTDLLVNIVPIGFFMDIAAWVGGLMVFFSALVIAGSTVYLRKTRSRYRH